MLVRPLRTFREKPVMKTVLTRLGTASLIAVSVLALGACSTTDQGARCAAASMSGEQAAQQALATAIDTRAELNRVERTFNLTAER